MIEPISQFWQSLTWGSIMLGVGIFVGSIVVSILIVGVMIVKIPANYFSSHYQEDFLPNSSWVTRWGATIAKNLVGAVLVAAGIVMLIGPGQGILTILVGLILMDIPGKRPLEARIIKRPTVLAAVNKLRAKYDKPELVID
ncbi:MAG: hypothetical protein WBD16_00645 [Pyrinomonadaceae bacterium]